MMTRRMIYLNLHIKDEYAKKFVVEKDSNFPSKIYISGDF